MLVYLYIKVRYIWFIKPSILEQDISVLIYFHSIIQCVVMSSELSCSFTVLCTISIFTYFCINTTLYSKIK